MFQQMNLYFLPLTRNIVIVFSVFRIPDHGQNPSESEKKTGSLENWKSWYWQQKQRTKPHRKTILVLTEMSADCPGGLEVTTADQYSQNQPSPLT
jgi:hypothetical protein